MAYIIRNAWCTLPGFEEGGSVDESTGNNINR